MKRSLALLLAFLPGSSLAQTSDICAQIQALTTDTASGLSYGSDIAACTQSLALGGAISIDCAWAFDFRAEAATDRFNRVAAAVEDCADRIDFQDQGVNHPDSYDLRQFSLGEAIIHISLKDKGALSQTYVFVRVQR